MHETITLEEQSRVISSVMMNSFRLARGHEPAQDEMLLFASQNLDVPIDHNTAFKRAFHPLLEDCKRITGNTNQHPALVPKPSMLHDTAQAYVHEQLVIYMDVFRGYVFGEPIRIRPARLASTIIESDNRWLPTNVKNRESISIKPFSSNLVKLAVLGQKSGLSVFDKMFTAVRENGLPQLLSGEDKGEIDQDYLPIVRDVYLGHIATHPEHRDQVEAALDNISNYTNLPETRMDRARYALGQIVHFKTI